MANTCVGTPCYLSPEMCQDIPYSSKADVWVNILLCSNSLPSAILGRPVPNQPALENISRVSNYIVSRSPWTASVTQHKDSMCGGLFYRVGCIGSGFMRVAMTPTW